MQQMTLLTLSLLFLISSAACGPSGVCHPNESPAVRLDYYTNATPLFLVLLLSLYVTLSH